MDENEESLCMSLNMILLNNRQDGSPGKWGLNLTKNCLWKRILCVICRNIQEVRHKLRFELWTYSVGKLSLLLSVLLLSIVLPFTGIIASCSSTNKSNLALLKFQKNNRSNVTFLTEAKKRVVLFLSRLLFQMELRKENWYEILAVFNRPIIIWLKPTPTPL